MPLITDNLVVAGVPATTPKAKTEQKKTEEISFEQVKQQAWKEQTKIEVEHKHVHHHRIVKKEDGELIRHINTKSQYLRDVFEDF